jgi:osmotically-inducible protein OsmY
MRKYGMWVLSLGLMAAAPGVTNADGFLGFGSRRTAPQVTAPRMTRTARPRPLPQAAGAQNNQQVAERIARALRDARLNGYDVEIEFKNGVATLKGDIADPAQRAKALALVAQVPGVRQVSNQLKPRTANPAPPAARRSAPVQQVAAQQLAPARPVGASNQQLANRVAKSLSSAGLSGYDVQIRVENGLATLAGAVESGQQKMQAERVTQTVPGITRVDNKLKVLATRRVAPVSYQPPAPPAGPPQSQPTPQPQRVSALPVPAIPSASYAGPNGGYASGVPMMDGPVYDQPNLPGHAWPSYAAYPNSAAVTYPKEYSPSAFPYIGPFYPYPQVPLGWRKAQLEWDDGYWNLNFNPRTERWFWFMNPNSWK